MASSLAGPRCINGQLARPMPPSDDSPSTACQASPGFGSPPGIAPSRKLPPPPPPPAPRQRSNAAVNPVTYPAQWTPLHTRPKTSGGGGPQVQEEEEQGREQVTRPIHTAMHTHRKEDTHRSQRPTARNRLPGHSETHVFICSAELHNRSGD